MNWVVEMAPADRATVPVAVRAPRDTNRFEIDWADGHCSIYTNSLLRGYCPCAGCQGHSGSIRWFDGGDATLEHIEEVGSYGLSLRWADGHDTGIYTFRFLRSLCACPECLPGSSHERREPLAR